MQERRDFIRGAILGSVGLLAAGTSVEGAPPAKRPEPEEGVSPAEDLMREHGVLKRVLLVYREAVRRLSAAEELPPEPLADAAAVIRSFIEDYHEKLEEDFLFPRFRKARREVELVDTLQAQHLAGRRLTDVTLRLAKGQSLRSAEERKQLADSLSAFVRMYEPHEAREDTVLFPTFRTLVKRSEYAALGEEFEKKEHQLFGEGGFEKIVDRVAGIERRLGVYELSQFMPKV